MAFNPPYRWRRPDRHAIIAASLLSFAVVFGGGGSPSPRSELLLQLLTALAVMAWVLSSSPRRSRAAPLAWLLTGLLVALPIIQLVPLPPSIWQELPGRDSTKAALDLIGRADGWRSLSLVPHMTFAALLSLVPPVVVLLMVASLPVPQRKPVLIVAAAAGFASVLLGAAQLVDGSDALRIYDYTHVDWITGFQANRNATADVFLIAMLAFAAWSRGRPPRWRAATVGGLLLLALGCVMTGSRAGIALLAPVFIASFLFSGALKAKARLGLVAGGVAAVVAAGAGLVLAMSRNTALTRVVERFDAQDDFRRQLWADGWQAALAYWPFGGGMGGFVPLFTPFERLEVLDRTVPNRAHNDYLELLIEAGAFGVVALLAVASVFALAAVRAIRGSEVPANHAFFAFGAGMVIAAHSLVDYPMRAMSLACLLAAAVALLLPPVLPRKEGN